MNDDQLLNQESIEIGMQILHGDVIAMYVQDEFSGGGIVVQPDLPVTITNINHEGAADSAFGILSRVFPCSHMIMLVYPEGQSSHVLPLEKLPDVDFGDESVTLVVPPLHKMEAWRSPFTLQHLIARLRDEDGCPWDRKQTNATLRDAIINEAYEVTDAIDSEDWENLAEELGDLFLLVAMHAQIAEESGHFQLEDVYEQISRKIVRRHPHVFGDAEADDPEAVIATWNEVKAQEKAEHPSRPEKASDGEPRSMPSLTRAARVLSRHPVTIEPVTDDDALLRAVSDIVSEGRDPEIALRDALARHVARMN